MTSRGVDGAFGVPIFNFWLISARWRGRGVLVCFCNGGGVEIGDGAGLRHPYW